MKKFLKWFVIVIVGFGIVGSLLDNEETEEIQVKEVEEVIIEEPEEVIDYEALKVDFRNIVNNSNNLILKISAENESYNVMAVNVDGNVWEASSETDKLDFVKTIRNTIANLIYKHNIISRGGTILVHYYDENDYALAKQSLWTNEYKIER